jgi:hypothetical protein
VIYRYPLTIIIHVGAIHMATAAAPVTEHQTQVEVQVGVEAQESSCICVRPICVLEVLGTIKELQGRYAVIDELSSTAAAAAVTETAAGGTGTGTGALGSRLDAPSTGNVNFNGNFNGNCNGNGGGSGSGSGNRPNEKIREGGDTGNKIEGGDELSSLSLLPAAPWYCARDTDDEVLLRVYDGEQVLTY